MQSLKKRSSIRLRLGKIYFIGKRLIQWHLGSIKYASSSSTAKLAHQIFTHKSLIMRPLKQVDMYLQENKKTNLSLAISKLDGFKILPGETLSFWRVVGLPTKKKGYLEGLELSSGSLRKNIGGGLCQLSNLIYWMTLHTPLQVKERWRHSFDVFPDIERTLPFGSGATVAYNYVDLQIYNPSQNVYQLSLWLDETHLCGAWLCDEEVEYSYNIIEKNHIIKLQPWGGYTRHNELYREVTHKDSCLVTEEFITANNAIMMYNPSLEYRAE